MSSQPAFTHPLPLLHRHALPSTSRRRPVYILPRCRALDTLPLQPPRRDRQTLGARVLSYAQILKQSAEAIQRAVSESGSDVSLKLTVDFPPEASETSAGTLVSRYENNLNFMEKLASTLSPQVWTRIGGEVAICDNVNPQGGGEYLTDDECLVGLQKVCEEMGGRKVVLIINAGVDVGTLGELKDVTGDVVVLVNCGIERVSWVDRFRIGKALDGFVPVYSLKKVGAGGWLLGGGDEWTVFVESAQGVTKVASQKERPSIVEAERLVRLALAGMLKQS